MVKVSYIIISYLRRGTQERGKDMKEKEIKEVEELIQNYFTELFLADKDCTDIEAMLDAKRWEAYDNGDYDKYFAISIDLLEAIESHI